MRDLIFLVDIYQSIQSIFKYSINVDYESLENNEEKQDAILRRLTIIGEATKKLSVDFREEHNSIPWKKIAGMRDMITHNYNEIDLKQVWKVITIDLPSLYEYLTILLESKNLDK
jgi:uncharacterized protein with HEPN domain